MKVLKALSHNAVLLTDDVGELVVIGKGIGFQKKAGDPVDMSLADQTFRPTAPGGVDRLAALIEQIPVEDIAIAAEVIRLGGDRLGEHSDNLLIPLADHISFALRRERSGMTITYPLADEVIHLYPHEVALAREALALIETVSGVRLPEIEAVPLALHFVNARFETTSLAPAVEMTETFAQILDLVRYDHVMEIDAGSLDATRFITHLRYLFLRHERGGVATSDPAMVEAVRSGTPAAYRSAEKVKALLERKLGWTVGGDEVLYLALHIHRLTQRRD